MHQVGVCYNLASEISVVSDYSCCRDTRDHEIIGYRTRPNRQCSLVRFVTCFMMQTSEEGALFSYLMLDERASFIKYPLIFTNRKVANKA
jgi:hypothetical protein